MQYSLFPLRRILNRLVMHSYALNFCMHLYGSFLSCFIPSKWCKIFSFYHRYFIIGLLRLLSAFINITFLHSYKLAQWCNIRSFHLRRMWNWLVCAFICVAFLVHSYPVSSHPKDANNIFSFYHIGVLWNSFGSQWIYECKNFLNLNLFHIGPMMHWPLLQLMRSRAKVCPWPVPWEICFHFNVKMQFPPN